MNEIVLRGHILSLQCVSGDNASFGNNSSMTIHKGSLVLNLKLSKSKYHVHCDAMCVRSEFFYVFIGM